MGKSNDITQRSGEIIGCDDVFGWCGIGCTIRIRYRFASRRGQTRDGGSGWCDSVFSKRGVVCRNARITKIFQYPSEGVRADAFGMQTLPNGNAENRK